MGLVTILAIEGLAARSQAPPPDRSYQKKNLDREIETYALRCT
jgi:hypothetical protein